MFCVSAVGHKCVCVCVCLCGCVSVCVTSGGWYLPIFVPLDVIGTPIHIFELADFFESIIAKSLRVEFRRWFAEEYYKEIKRRRRRIRRSRSRRGRSSRREEEVEEKKKKKKKRKRKKKGMKKKDTTKKNIEKNKFWCLYRIQARTVSFMKYARM